MVLHNYVWCSNTVQNITCTQTLTAAAITLSREGPELSSSPAIAQYGCLKVSHVVVFMLQRFVELLTVALSRSVCQVVLTGMVFLWSLWIPYSAALLCLPALSGKIFMVGYGYI